MNFGRNSKTKMKMNARQILILVALLFLQDYVWYLLKVNLGISTPLYVLDFVLKALLLYVLFQSVAYRWLYDMKSNKFVVLGYLLIPLVVSLLVAQRMIRIDQFYFFSKKVHLTTSGNIWEFDPRLAHHAVPNAQGNYYYFIGDSIRGEVPVLFDENGFRKAPESLALHSDTLDLFMGCSFTFGDNVLAEQTYAYLTAQKLHHSYLNTGASAYGFGQMLQLAEEWLPRRRFRYAFIQLSPWLSDRAMNINGPTMYGYRPFPYFSDQGDDFALNYPAYRTQMYHRGDWKSRPASYPEKLRFSFTDGFICEFFEYATFKWATLRMKLGMTPKPTNRKLSLEKHFYDAMIARCREHGATPVVLKLRYPEADCRELLDYLAPKATVVDLDHALDSVLQAHDATFESYYELYHVHKGDTLYFDKHPNPYAHEQIAQTIYEALNGGR